MVLRSSIEVEYKALTDTVAKLTWLQALLNELGINSSLTPILWCDNLGFITTAPIAVAGDILCNLSWHAASKIQDALVMRNIDYLRSLIDYMELQLDLKALGSGIVQT
ncbi:gag/pol polyprotein [Tanacetum coccineum]